MGFAELKALAAQANQEVEEGQAVSGVAKEKLNDTLNAVTSTTNDVNTQLESAKEKFSNAQAQYAGISDNDAIQEAAEFAVKGYDELAEAQRVLNRIVKDFQAALKLAEETVDKAVQQGEAAKESANLYTSRF
jgi:lipid-binding SYLF domain-containing protein